MMNEQREKRTLNGNEDQPSDRLQWSGNELDEMTCDQIIVD